MKKPVVERFLSRLDNSLRWTGIPARVAEEMSDDPSVDRRRRPLRWIPLWPIVYSCALFAVSLTWPSALIRLTHSLGLDFTPSFVLSLVPSLVLVVAMMTPMIYTNGPLGKPSLDDDEREAALRKDSFLFCFALLAGLNCFGQPFLMVLAVLQDWRAPQIASVAGTTVMLNATLFGCLPTLYASWNLKQLPSE
jgi:hypothetical protein